ncbi:aminotransferase class I/II-fold pyridoxal phosphate-dependent enzyme, partial [Clostridiales bacterium]|nr:aminotransferase class I/II-fold pyridoxal phosphate-dependent enzyme [Clostridiales bacterium]
MHAKEIGGEDLKKTIHKILSDLDASMFAITDRRGDPELRKEISLFLQKMNIKAKVREIQIVSETFQAIDYISSMILDEKDAVIIPETVCPEIIRIFSAAGAKIQSVKMDKDGILCDEVEKALKNRKTKLIYVEPDFAIPTGTVMSIERRKQLLRLSYKYNVPIIEEGGNADLRHEGKSLPPIKALDTHDSVADKKYFNHFSITPYISCISSQMLDFAGFSDYSEILCFQSICSNRLILSHICSCKIGKYVGKVSGFTNGFF